MAALVFATTAGAAFPGFTGRIAFVYVNEVDAYQTICASSADGAGRRCPGGIGDFLLYQPAYSPDGSRIAYAKLQSDSANELWVMNADGTVKHKLGEGTGPAWSPDGTRIAFEAEDSTSSISVMDADGSNVEALVSDGSAPAWSPDGALIAYSTTQNVYVVDSEGGVPVLLIENARDPDWSADGTKIAFSRYDDVDDDWDVWTADADGSDELLLTHNDVYDGDPTWSPDGTRIAYTSDHPPNGFVGVATMNASDGSGRIFITPATDDYFRPTWQSLIIRLDAAPRIVNYGTSPDLEAQLFWGDTTENDVLSLFQTPVGLSRTFIGDASVDADGLVSFSVDPKRKTTYSVEWTGDAAHPPATMNVLVEVRAIAALKLLRFYATSGAYKLYHAGAGVFQRARVTPNHAGKRVTFRSQRLSGGRWVYAGSAKFRLGANGTVTAIYRAPRGTYRSQILFAADTDHLGDSSPWRYFKIR